MKILAENTMAIMIDVQENLMPVIYQREEVIQNTVKLINGLNVLNIPLMISQQYTKGLGMTVAPVREAVGENFIYHEKLSFSCMGEEEMMQKVKSSNRKNIIICGAEAHICVLQTIIDLLALEYQVLLVTDCVGSRKSHDKEIGIQRALSEGAILTTYEAILFELTKVAGTEVFKKISKIIK